MTKFTDKVVLITGAASGFGKILANEFGKSGAKLILGDLNEDGVIAVGEEVKADTGADVVAKRCDVAKETDCEALVVAGVEAFGRLDIAINNAGVGSEMKPLIETTEQDMDFNYSINTKGVFFGMKYQIRQMLTQEGGAILNVSSMAGLNGAPKIAAYSAAKHAVIGLTKTGAVEYGRKNIRVNAVCPYFSPTPLISGSPIEENEDRYAMAVPMKRLGKPEEMVATMMSILDPDNTYLNGQAIAVDGGLSSF